MPIPGPTSRPRLILAEISRGVFYGSGNNKGAIRPFVLFQFNPKLLVIDVHRNFKAETDVAVFRCLPLHLSILQSG
jgi:hypothetical protein